MLCCKFDLNIARTKACAPYNFIFQSHHTHGNIWTPTLVEKLATNTELKNRHDKYVVKVLKDNEILGHIPRDLSKYCTSALLCRVAVGIRDYMKNRKQTWKWVGSLK